MRVLCFTRQLSRNCISLVPKIQSLVGHSLDRCFTRHFFLQSVRFHSAEDVYRCNVKIGSLSRAGKIEAARQLFDTIPNRDVVSWNAIITGYWQNGYFEEAKRLFELMPMRNVVSWNSMIAGCVENDRIDEAFEFFGMMPERNTASWNAMISGFVRCGNIKEASRLFEVMPWKNVISYTAMIDGYAQKGKIERARALFDCMPCKNAVSWTVMISGYVENGRYGEARELFDQMPDKNVVAMTAMITGYSKEGKMENARILFEEIHCRDRVSFNAMITGYAQNGSGEEALKLHIQMLRSGMQPDHSTLVSVLTACSTLASLEEGRQTHVLVLKNGFDSHVSVCNALITMYSKCGGILDSELAFGHLDSPDLVSWNTIIAAFAQHGLYEKAIYFFKQMGCSGFEPDGITFLSLLSACGHAGMVNESMYWFDSMIKNYNIIPRSEHYACLVGILGRAGQVEKAYKMIQEMPFEGDSGVWGALLAGCRVCLNVELGQLAAKKMVELEPKNSGAYIMLSNIYAAAGMWKEVTRVRSLMKEQGVKKQPAYSWMEIENKVHYFLGGDTSHPDIEEIQLELKRINLQMKSMDRIADIVSKWSCLS
ncbi:pentatricopeptide repeat-containing protein At4g02750-like [Cornus florida]|uniref:pentatricopeptide repeat-containing protein At4g02750-like n=1 Tax=Cornus florida TaxID=4283 RepID=UPI00289F5927|nr:pentatricopeptide repeat-containing protein At4g02750-like [Cornus florida]